MNYSAIKYFDIANGEGVRTSLFVSGCRRHCPYCFNGEAWRFDAGEPFDEAVQAKVIESLGAAFCDGLTILGGEPMEPENQEGLVEFVERVKREVPNKAIWCFTGDTLDELEPAAPISLRSPIVCSIASTCWSTGLSKTTCTTLRCASAARPTSASSI